ncbi:MAG: acyltransferase, partial [Bacillota bacterium]
CEIGYRAHIGAGAVIGQGVRVGDDAVVCPGSVVEKDVEAGMIVAGAPARVTGNAVFDIS